MANERMTIRLRHAMARQDGWQVSSPASEDGPSRTGIAPHQVQAGLAASRPAISKCEILQKCER